MSTEELSLDNLETKIMSILYANIDTNFNQFALFNKLIKDKFPEMYNTTINPNIKAKFLLVLRNLMSRYDDVKVTKDKNIYSVVCVSDKNKNDFIQWVSDADVEPQITINTQNTPVDSVDYSYMLNYIIDNNLTEDMDYIDPFDGNTIYHDLVVTNNLAKISNLVNTNKFNYTIKNKHGQTPIELATNQPISNILIMGLMRKYIEEVEHLKTVSSEQIKKINTQAATIEYYQSKKYRDSIIIHTNLFVILYHKMLFFAEGNKLLVTSTIIAFIAYFFLFR